MTMIQGDRGGEMGRGRKREEKGKKAYEVTSAEPL